MAEKQRGSGETERKLEGGESQPVRAPAPVQENKGGGLHPAVYIG